MNLNYDILWTVFTLNASQGSSRLEITLASSQVCQEWRNIILGSSTLWGRLVLLTPSKKQEWLEEILKRSGCSPLWVEALLGDTIEQLTSVADNYWERIELLDISGTAIRLSYHEEDLLKVLSRPAPFLRSFSLINADHNMRRSISFQNHESLFALDAPLLRSLVTDVIVLPHQSALFSNLRELSWRLYGTIREMLNCLRNMPNIETLTLKRTIMEEIIDRNVLDDLPLISLPRLTQLSMMLSSLEAFVALFDRITSSSTGCVSNVNCYIWSQYEDLTSCLLQMGGPLAKIIANHIKIQKDSHFLDLWIWNHKFFFMLDSSSQIKFYWKDYGFDNAPPPESLSLFFQAFKTVNLSHITHLKVMHGLNFYTPRYFSFFLPLLSSTLSSITHLETNVVFFRLLYFQYMQDQDCAFVPFDHFDCAFPFPNLQNLQIKLSLHSGPAVRDRLGVQLDGHIFLHFLRTQKALGRGPSVLCVQALPLNGTHLDNMYYRQLLEEIDGLEVVWTIRKS